MDDPDLDDSLDELILLSDDPSSIPRNELGQPLYRLTDVSSPKTQEEEDRLLEDDPPIKFSDEYLMAYSKRKLEDKTSASSPSKFPKLDIDEQIKLDDEVSEIISIGEKEPAVDVPSTSKVMAPVLSSPLRMTKRSSSTEIKPHNTPKLRLGGGDLTYNTYKLKSPEAICEEKDPNDSQDMRLVLSPTLETSDNGKKSDMFNCSSDPVYPSDRQEVLPTGKLNVPHSEGCSFSDQSNLSLNFKGKTTDQESTDSVSSILDSPENIPTVTSKLISKLSNGNSSTPTEIPGANESDCTPDTKLNGQKGSCLKNDSFRGNSTTTPSTISPFQNGHGSLHTPQIPTFDIHLSHNEEGEFQSLYIVRTDNDLGMDMCKEYQRFSKRFSIDPYLADVSVSNSSSSVTSTGMINLPNRTSFVSTTSSTSSTSSNRTSDGTFVVPQPPKKTISSYPGTSVVKGYDLLLKKIQDIFSHCRDTSIDEPNRLSGEEKVSIGIQAGESASNGNTSPDEFGNYDRTTPKSSLKKARVRGRRPLTGKTKRALLPTQIEESESIQEPNSPEMDDDDEDYKPSTKEEKIIGTPKSVSKLKQKRSRPVSPRPATPVEKAPIKTEYPGFPPDTVVLAKWVDKRYYSGKVLEIIEPYKYLIKFDDGQNKALLDDFIIFGDTTTLPLVGKSVFVMVDPKDGYEPALVLGIDDSEAGVIKYKCLTDGDKSMDVPASGLYLSEDQARFIKESVPLGSPPCSPCTPRRRGLRELDLDNIIQGPRNVRNRDRPPPSIKKRTASPRSPKASTSGLKSAATATPFRKRVTSESSSISESSNSAPLTRIEHIAGVEPEVQRTPKKLDGVKAGPQQLKGVAKQNIGKKNFKLTKLDHEDTTSLLGPIPEKDSKLFDGLHFLLTCSEPPKRSEKESHSHESRHYSSEEDGDTSSTMTGTDCEDLLFTDKPFNKEHLKEQLEAGGGIVHTHFDDIPRSAYKSCRLISPRPCRTAKYMLCVSADVIALCHSWVIFACVEGVLPPVDAYILPAGWSIRRKGFINWGGISGKRSTTFFKDKVILLCGDQETFVKFWERILNLSGATTRVVNEEDMNMTGAIALVTEWDCPHEVQNKANQENIPLVSMTWIQQCIIESRIIPPTSHDKFSFMYAEPE